MSEALLKQYVSQTIIRQFAFDWAMQVFLTNKQHHQLNARWQRGRSVWTGLLECPTDCPIYVATIAHWWTLLTLNTLECAHLTLLTNCGMHTTDTARLHSSQAQSTNGFCSQLQWITMHCNAAAAAVQVPKCIQLNHRDPLLVPKSYGSLV